jgi:hypothetical protein
MNQRKCSRISIFCRSRFCCFNAIDNCLDTVKNWVHARLIITGNIRFYYIFGLTSDLTTKVEVKYFLSLNSSFEGLGAEAILFQCGTTGVTRVWLSFTGSHWDYVPSAYMRKPLHWNNSIVGFTWGEESKLKISFYVLYLKFNKVFPVITMKPNHYFKKWFRFTLLPSI